MHGGSYLSEPALVNTRALAGIAPRHEIPHLADLCISQGIRIGFLRQFVHSLPDFRPHRTARFLAAQPVYAVH